MRSLTTIYALSVCLASLMCFVIALGIGLYDAIQIAAPTFTLPYYDLYHSNDVYRRTYRSQKDLSDSDIQQLRAQGFESAQRAERRAALQSGAFVLIILAINVAVFSVHWRISKKHDFALKQDSSS